VHIIRGKHKPTYSPNYDCGDVVVVVNAADVKLTGNKVENKLYRWHTGYPGGLKELTAGDQLKNKPEEVCAHNFSVALDSMCRIHRTTRLLIVIAAYF
jgi:large subunit ribosomal protein L13